MVRTHEDHGSVARTTRAHTPLEDTHGYWCGRLDLYPFGFKTDVGKNPALENPD